MFHYLLKGGFPDFIPLPTGVTVFVIFNYCLSGNAMGLGWKWNDKWGKETGWEGVGRKIQANVVTLPACGYNENARVIGEDGTRDAFARELNMLDEESADKEFSVLLGSIDSKI